MLYLIFMIAILMLSACVPASTSVGGCPTTSPSIGSQFTVALSANVGSAALGAYSVTFMYDTRYVTVASVQGGTTSEFSSAPSSNSNSFATGSSRIASKQTANSNRPTGSVGIARVTLNVVGAGSTTLGIVTNSLYNPNSQPIAFGGTSGCSFTSH